MFNLEDILNKIIQGDSLEVLKTFPDESIDCVVTSPPYWGLRDYGTANWEGGTGDCDHKIPAGEHDPKNPESGSHIARFNRESCFKCGAIRKDAQLGLEKTPEEYVAKMVVLFREIRRVLKKEGNLWLNLGDTYSAARWSSGKGQPMNKNKDLYRAGEETENRASGLPDKNLVGIPWRTALALQADGWILRQDIIWEKPNPMPESVTDRCTKSHEYIFLLTKSPKYYFDHLAIKEKAVSEGSVHVHKAGNKMSGVADDKLYATKPQRNMVTGATRNKRDVWTIVTKPYKGAHFATFPEALIEPMVKAGCPVGGVILDPFMGAGTTGLVAKKQGRNYVGIELNTEYIKIAEARIGNIML